jgi:hypothetical protein
MGNDAVTFGCIRKWQEDSGDPLVDNDHWIPQTTILGKDEVCFEYIGKLENISQDAEIILEKMECDIPFPTQHTVRFAPTNANFNSKEVAFSALPLPIFSQFPAERFVGLVRDSQRMHLIYLPGDQAIMAATIPYAAATARSDLDLTTGY